MFTLSPSTRVAWEDILTEYGVEEESAQTLVDLIVGDPRVAARRPQSREDLESTVKTVEEVIGEMDLAEFESISDQQTVKDELIGQLRIDLDLDSPLGSSTAQATQSEAKALFAASQSSEETPPEELQHIIDDFVEQINDDDSPLEFSDFQKIVRWVTVRTEGNPEGVHR
jgi:hypothetical protein